MECAELMKKLEIPLPGQQAVRPGLGGVLLGQQAVSFPGCIII